MDESVNAYRRSRDRITALVGTAPTSSLRRPVPACPRWRVHDLVAHLAGMASDFCGDLAAVLTGSFWSHDEVERREIDPRRDWPTPDVLAEWAAVSPRFEQVVAAVEPGLAEAIAADYVCHEHDVRGALHEPGAREAAEVGFALWVYARALGRRIDVAGLPALEIQAGDEARTVGQRPPGVGVAATPFELLRALTGRRARSQVADLAWTGDRDAYVDIFPMFEWPPAPLDE